MNQNKSVCTSVSCMRPVVLLCTIFFAHFLSHCLRQTHFQQQVSAFGENTMYVRMYLCTSIVAAHQMSDTQNERLAGEASQTSSRTWHSPTVYSIRESCKMVKYNSLFFHYCPAVYPLLFSSSYKVIIQNNNEANDD